jgi:hypothetical protein
MDLSRDVNVFDALQHSFIAVRHNGSSSNFALSMRRRRARLPARVTDLKIIEFRRYTHGVEA